MYCETKVKPVSTIQKKIAAMTTMMKTITAEITVPEGGAEGMIVTSGGRFAGYGMYLLEGKPVFLWNMLDLERIKWEGTEALSPGKHVVEFDFKYDGMGAGTLAFNDFSGVGKGGIEVAQYP